MGLRGANEMKIIVSASCSSSSRRVYGGDGTWKGLKGIRGNRAALSGLRGRFLFDVAANRAGEGRRRPRDDPGFFEKAVWKIFDGVSARFLEVTCIYE
jgi:hypothetical protein